MLNPHEDLLDGRVIESEIRVDHTQRDLTLKLIFIKCVANIFSCWADQGRLPLDDVLITASNDSKQSFLSTIIQTFSVLTPSILRLILYTFNGRLI